MYSRSSKGGLAQDILGPVALKVMRIRVVTIETKAISLGSVTSRGAAAAAPKGPSQILAQEKGGGMGTKEKLHRYALHAVRMRGSVGTQDVRAPRFLIGKGVMVASLFKPPIGR